MSQSNSAASSNSGDVKRRAIEKLSACVEMHRAGEAMSGYRVAHVEVPVAALETVLKAVAK